MRMENGDRGLLLVSLFYEISFFIRCIPQIRVLRIEVKQGHVCVRRTVSLSAAPREVQTLARPHSNG